MPESHIDHSSSQALFEAIIRGDLPRVRTLLETGVSPNVNDEESGISPLHLAIEHQLLDILEVLIDAGADVNEDEEDRGTPLTHAIDIEEYSGDRPFGVPAKAAITSLLVTRGADVNQIDSRGYTPLQYARDAEHVQAIEILLKNGAT